VERTLKRSEVEKRKARDGWEGDFFA
jgi:hypothetical protein